MEREENEMVNLDDAIIESGMLKDVLKDTVDDQTQVSYDILLLMASIIWEKIRFFSKRHGFRVPKSELFYIEQFPDFIRMAMEKGTGK